MAKKFRLIDENGSNIIVRPYSEFNTQAEIYMKLRESLEPFGFKIFGEIRLLGEQKIKGSRKQKGRLDIGIFKKGKLIYAIEIKGRHISGKKQRKKYLKLGVPKIDVYNSGHKKKNIDRIVNNCKEYILKTYKNIEIQLKAGALTATVNSKILSAGDKADMGNATFGLADNLERCKSL